MIQNKWPSPCKQSWRQKCTKIESLEMKIRHEELPLTILPVPCTAVLVEVPGAGLQKGHPWISQEKDIQQHLFTQEHNDS